MRGFRSLLGFPLVLFLGAALSGCGGSQASSPTITSAAAKITTDAVKAHTVRSPACERNSLDGVHGPDRLKVLSSCAAFQGTVTQTPVKNPDGDVSFEARPDPGYANMLNAHNRSEGGLHIEIVPRDQPGCKRGKPVHVDDVPDLGSCSGRDIAAPALGAHVRVVGPWVLDLHNNWYEIHPAWSVKQLGQ
jgi:hypothetical protein